MFLGLVFVVTLSAAALYLTVEQPVANLEKYLLTPSSSNQRKGEKGGLGLTRNDGIKSSGGAKSVVSRFLSVSEKSIEGLKRKSLGNTKSKSPVHVTSEESKKKREESEIKPDDCGLENGAADQSGSLRVSMVSTGLENSVKFSEDCGEEVGPSAASNLYNLQI